ncbi:MAG: hypothetical protein AB1651_12730 [Pseudomonadota bacterium]
METRLLNPCPPRVFAVVLETGDEVVTESPGHLRRSYDPATGLALLSAPGSRG